MTALKPCPLHAKIFTTCPECQYTVGHDTRLEIANAAKAFLHHMNNEECGDVCPTYDRLVKALAALDEHRVPNSEDAGSSPVGRTTSTEKP